MVTGEFYTKKEHFPGFGRPYVFNAQILLKCVKNHFVVSQKLDYSIYLNVFITVHMGFFFTG